MPKAGSGRTRKATTLDKSPEGADALLAEEDPGVKEEQPENEGVGGAEPVPADALAQILAAVGGLTQSAQLVSGRLSELERAAADGAQERTRLRELVTDLTNAAETAAARQQSEIDAQLARALAAQDPSAAASPEGEPVQSPRGRGGRGGRGRGGRGGPRGSPRAAVNRAPPPPQDDADICLLPRCSAVVVPEHAPCCSAPHLGVLELRKKANCGNRSHGCTKPVYVANSGLAESFCSRECAIEATQSGPGGPSSWYCGSEERRIRTGSDSAAAEPPAAPIVPVDPLLAATQAQLQSLIKTVAGLTTSVASIATSRAAAPEPQSEEEDEFPPGPYPPYHCDRNADVINPHTPFREPHTSLCPHVYQLSDTNPYYKGLRKRKSQAWHEYQIVCTQCDYQWDRLALWDRFLPALEGLAGVHDDGDSIYQAALAIRNSDREEYNVLNRRRCTIELRCRCSFAELESTAKDQRMLEAIEEKMAGFLKGFANSASLDPTMRKWIRSFGAKAEVASFNAHAKSAGQATVKKKGTGPGPKKPGP